MTMTNVLLNPVRQRIIQYLMIKGNANVSDIAASLNDVSQASIYRHMKILLQAKVIAVTDEKQIRGTIEKTYALAQVNPDGNQDLSLFVQNVLLSVTASFAKYFAGENPQPEKDMLTVAASTLMLSDEEMVQFLNDYSKLVEKAMQKEAGENRKPRSMMIISAPVENEQNK